MNRRAFLTGMISTASGLVLPYEPKRIYSFPSRMRMSNYGRVINFGTIAMPAIDISVARLKHLKQQFLEAFPAAREYIHESARAT